MDKTIEIVLVATVVIMTGAAVMYLFSGQIGEFDESASTESNAAQCQTIKTRVEATQCLGSGSSVSTPQSWQDNNCGETAVEEPSCG